MHSSDVIVKDLVLLGGGHSHIAVLKRFGMKPVPGLRLTLITREVHTPYSGMLPGYIAGHYDYDQVHIDLRPLSVFANARLYHADATGLDLDGKRVFLKDRPPVAFDTLSINIGSRPNRITVPGADEHALAVKPIDQFLAGWEQLIRRVLHHQGVFRIAIVGGGAGGVELCLSIRHRLLHELSVAGKRDVELSLRLITDTDRILPTHNGRARRHFETLLREADVTVHTGSAVSNLSAKTIETAAGECFEINAAVWVTQASPPDWVANSALDCDQRGFIRVDESMQSVSHPSVFAAGDIASMDRHPRPKSGVYAVRQGPPLARNLRRVMTGKAPISFKPQTSALSLISTGDRRAVASRSVLSFKGGWVWRWKDWIDRRFVSKYNDLPVMEEKKPIRKGAVADDSSDLGELSTMAMRCGGCGAKVGATVLSRVVNQLKPTQRDDVLIGLNAPDDAAVLETPEGKVSIQSVDYFRSFIDDPYVFGKIASNHALGDLFAMGAEPQAAMAVATLPYASESVLEEQLYQLMSGALEVLNEAGAALVGGHSSEGSELAFGLSVTGLADRDALLRKGGMRAGDVLLLTKPLGTGTLFAADMRLKAKGRWVTSALEHMMHSNAAAARCLIQHGATACTDVTGFGLLGHLVEMLKASDCDAELELDSLPILDGALETVQMGIFSSLQPQNIRLRRAIKPDQQCLAHPHYPLIFDPQTAGGLLASVPAAKVQNCVQTLKHAGYASTCIIGRLVEREPDGEPVRLRMGTLAN